MDPDVFVILVSLAERELDYADAAKRRVLETALSWLQEMRDNQG